jgi:hypothetical protein
LTFKKTNHLLLEPNVVQPKDTVTVTQKKTTHSAHRYYLGYLLRTLSRKFGAANVKNFYICKDTAMTESSKESSEWIAGLDRGDGATTGLTYCSKSFVEFFELVLEIEDRFLETNRDHNASQLVTLLKSNEILLTKWATLWTGDASICNKAYLESVRIHVNGRMKAFVRYVRDVARTKLRIARAIVHGKKTKGSLQTGSKKALRTQLANLRSDEPK